MTTLRERVETWLQGRELCVAAARSVRDGEIADLGLFAAMCELWAADRRNSDREQEVLLARAARYRDLQFAALIETR